MAPAVGRSERSFAPSLRSVAARSPIWTPTGEPREMVTSSLEELRLSSSYAMRTGSKNLKRQSKFARLFGDEGFVTAVVVPDRARLSEAGLRSYDRAIEGPIKNAVASARQQLKQTRAERRRSLCYSLFPSTSWIEFV
jgi:hypothetical protein